MAANAKKKVRTRRRERKNIEKGQVHISSSFNNTMVTIGAEKMISRKLPARRRIWQPTVRHCPSSLVKMLPRRPSM